MMRRAQSCSILFLGTAGAMAVLACVTVPVAGASNGCRAPRNGEFPTVSVLRATQTGCTTARRVAEAIQAWWNADGALPSSFDIQEGGPIFHCRYQLRQGVNPYKTARCVAGRKVVTMELGS